MSVDPDAVETLVAAARRHVEVGPLPSCQLALAVDGEVVLDVTIAAPPDARYHVYSVTKSLIAGAMWLLLGEGEVTPETRAAEVVPGFGANGKDVITVEHLMTHTAGLARAPMPLELAADPERRLQRMSEWYPRTEPGEAYQYHAQAAHWVLAEMIARISGSDHTAFVAQRVIAPLGLGRFQLGVPLAQQGDIRDVSVVGDPPPETIDVPGIGTIDLSALMGEARHEFLVRYNEPWVRVLGPPGGGAVAYAADVALFFQALLHDRAGLWHPDVLADGTGRVRVTLPDPQLHMAANRTLGLVVAGDDGRGALRSFGFTNGPRTFGSPGAGGQVAWADPDNGMSFCFLTDGLERDPLVSGARAVELSTLAVACAGDRSGRPA